jgi:hypothetical protein
MRRSKATLQMIFVATMPRFLKGDRIARRLQFFRQQMGLSQ